MQCSDWREPPSGSQSGRRGTPLLKKLAGIKRLLGTQDYFRAEANDEQDIAVMQRAGAAGRFVGVFSLQAKSAGVCVPAADGTYENLLDGSIVTVKAGCIHCDGAPVIFRAPEREG